MQQHLPFNESNSAEPISPDDEEISQYNEQFDTFNGQKLTLSEKASAPTATQRLVLAIASLTVWALIFFVAAGAFISLGWWLTTGAVLLFCLFLFMILLSAINVAFNHSRSAKYVANPSSTQRLLLASISIIAWIAVALSVAAFVVLPINHWEKDTVVIFLLCGLALFTFLLSILNLTFNRSHSLK